MKKRKKKPYEPSQEEIGQKMLEIQTTWTKAERFRRRGLTVRDGEPAVEIKEVSSPWDGFGD